MVRITEELVRKKSEHNECLISTLEELSLHQEDIEKIEHIQNWCRNLQILLLQSNLISKIENLHKFKKLQYLNLALNNIERIENLEQLESLNKLDLTLNFIGDLTSVESLRDNYNLRELILTGNPCADFPNYRNYVIIALPQLQQLDSEEIKISDRLLARRYFENNRKAKVQAQADYSIKRDEQKIRYVEQKSELETKMASIEDEQERIKLFWDSKTENCPEVRREIHEQQKKARKANSSTDENKLVKKKPQLFAPCGRPYNINQPKLDFKFRDENKEFVLELKVYKFLDTAHIEVDLQPKYIRVSIKGKIFQLALAEEITTSGAIVQRSQITGELLIKAPKLNFDSSPETSRNSAVINGAATLETKNISSRPILKGPVNYRNIVDKSEESNKATIPNDISDVPDLE
ncbi:protein tilB [Episyrphus balteatus]|uniref:protein tilB n=1 Tax=Episyrphus balteatus TaxID=286459 RepID=UPI0024859D69|nr:protein tilB [Episyrphus balteatus]